jgi:hypothetical protein
MNESEDKALHQLIRTQLAGFEAEFDPAHWEELRQRMGRKRLWYSVLWSGVGVLVVSMLLVYFFQPRDMDIQKNTNVSLQPRKIEARRETNHVKNHFAKTHSRLTIPFEKVDKSKNPRLGGVGLSVTNLSLPKSVEINFNLLKIKNLDCSKQSFPLPNLTLPSHEEAAIRQQMQTGQFGKDSTSFRVLARNAGRWPNAVLVCDLTSSMYPYSTQLFAWLRQHTQHPAVKGTLFFTDCDSLGHETTPQGPAGRMFATRERTPERVLPLMLAAARNTLGNQQDAENDIEALIEAQRRFPEAKNLVLIADNSSRVKDLHRLAEVRLPVRVILCGSPWDTTQAFQPDFFEIATRTRGSLHTLEDDFSPTRLSHRDWVKVGPRYYWYHARKQRFVVSRFRQQPKRFLGLFWL